MKAIVTKNLNVRVGAPSVNAPCFNYLVPGSIIDVEEETIPGDPYDGIDRWYKGLDGNYYWRGGLVENSEPIAALNFEALINSSYDENNYKLKSDLNYNDLLDLKSTIKSNKGNGIKIGVLDQPIPVGPELFKTPVTLGWNGGEVYDHHGIFRAGLIGGYYKDQYIFEGIASNCSIISLPLYEDGLPIKEKQLIENLRHFSEVNTDNKLVINISFSWSDPSRDLVQCFEELSVKHILIASAGVDEKLSKDQSVQWPASLSEVISVGSISKRYIEKSPKPGFSDKVDIVVPNFDFISFNHFKNIPFFKDIGDSCATAITTGIIALLISKVDNMMNKNIILAKLEELNICNKLSADSFSKLNLINPKL